MLGHYPDEVRKFQEWLIHLPKILWELSADNLPLSEVIFVSFLGGARITFDTDIPSVLSSSLSPHQVIFRLLLRLSQRKSSLLDVSVSHFPRGYGVFRFSTPKHSVNSSTPIRHFSLTPPLTVPLLPPEKPTLPFAVTHANFTPHADPKSGGYFSRPSLL